MRRALLALAACAGVACGGPARGPSSPEPSADAQRTTEEAATAWGALDPERAARLADRAVAMGAGDSAREIAGRAYLAVGRFDDAVRALGGVSDPELLRLRASAQLAAGDLEGATASLEAARARARDEDPWTEAMLPALRATRGAGAACVVEGDEATLPLEAAALPLVRVRVDAIETWALIGTGAFLTVLDPRVRASAGAIDELRLGALIVRNVPHTVRPLDSVRDALGVEVGMVLGADLLLRLSATLDGPGSRLVLRASPPTHSAAFTAPLLTPGSFLAVPVTVDDAPGWMTLDTAGLFPVALAAGAEEATGLDDAVWQPTPEGPSFTVIRRLRIGGLEVEEIPIIQGLLDEAHARAVGAPIAGSIGWGLLGQLTLGFDARARRLRFE